MVASIHRIQLALTFFVKLQLRNIISTDKKLMYSIPIPPNFTGSSYWRILKQNCKAMIIKHLLSSGQSE